MHRSDTAAEKMSLSARFGVSIAYYKPAHQEFHNIVLGLAHRHPEIKLMDEEIIAEADRWSMRHGGPSGRTATQFVDHLLGSGE